MTNTERRELTAAEIDLVEGGSLENTLVSNLMDASNKEAAYFTLLSGSAGTGNSGGSAMFDVRQNRTV
jgi:hypothetical protein